MNITPKDKTGKIKIAYKKTLWMYLLFTGTFFVNFSELSLSDYIINTFLIILTVGIGHSVGLHRGIIHKSYNSSKHFKNITIYLFVLTGMGSPLNWLKQHYFRDYWQNKENCPTYFRYQHNLITDYWWNLHLSYTPKNFKIFEIPKQDLNNKWLNHLNKYWLIHYSFFALIIFIVLGFNSLLFLVCFRSSLILIGHWFIGYSSHKWGYARYKIKGADESGYNDIILGLISFGEGFHNNHHSFPTSAKFSSKWYEIDIGWCLIKLCKYLSLIKNVKTQKNNLKSTAIPINH